MTQTIPTSVNLITGPLGSGKTTFIRHLLSQKPRAENWVLLVNEFGSVGIDGAILGQDSTVQSIQLPGGCICCTAKNELQQTLTEIIKTHQPHRILIEPTGLGEPDTLADILQAKTFLDVIQLQTIFAVLDCASVGLQDIQNLTIMQNLLTMADVVILNKQDLASAEQIETLKHYCDALYPPKQAILICQNGKVASHWLNAKHTDTTAVKQSSPELSHHQHNLTTSNNTRVMLPYEPTRFNQPVERLYKNQLGIQSIGFIFANNVTFDWKQLYSLFQSLNKTEYFQGVIRAKGVLKVGAPWMLFQWVNEQASREYISYRRDSRLELLIESPAPFKFQEFEMQLKACIL